MTSSPATSSSASAPAALPPSPRPPSPCQSAALQRVAHVLMGVCLGVMALAVFLNVVLRYGFGSGVAASEELSRLLFVWMVFIGATAAYPSGEHMAFTTLLERLRHRPRLLAATTVVLRVLVLLGCVLLGHGAWQQVRIGWDTVSVVLAYPVALLPLPVLLASVAIAAMALWELFTMRPLALDHGLELE